ncbi:MAG: hypothetical protein IKU42_00455 [Oscillospiraceae bacterium]|nr:hypothetical protein [Oscillospiraceae bacterium]
MTEIIFAVLGAAIAFCFMNRKKPEEKPKEIFYEEEGEGIEPSPMILRNGYGVTRDRKPTFAEQWVNIVNYCGESQLEGDYEENEGN